MSRFHKLLLKLLRGTSDASLAFDDLRYIMLRGRHHICRLAGLDERLTCSRRAKTQSLIR